MASGPFLSETHVKRYSDCVRSKGTVVDGGGGESHIRPATPPSVVPEQWNGPLGTKAPRDGSGHTELAGSPAAASPDHVRHFPELDGIRGVAILMVLVAHAADFLGVFPGPGQPGYGRGWKIVQHILLQGWGGVDVFFVLSGFLITGILLRARKRDNYFTSFYARRALRIFPIYYLMLSVTLFLGHVSHTFSALLPPHIRGKVPYFLYLQNWPWFWRSWAGMTGLWGVYWSLAVEEQFYMVWPTLVRFVNLPLIMFLCILGTLAEPLIRGLMFHQYGLQLGIMQAPFTRLDGLFLGAIVALYRELTGKPVSLRWACVSVVAGLGILGYIGAFYSRELGGSGPHIWTLGSTGFALIAAGLIAASHYRPKVLHAVLTWRPLLTAGKLSYGMYVYHVVIYWALATYVFSKLGVGLTGTKLIGFAAGSMCAAMALATVVAAVSFRYLETPFLMFKRHFPSPAARV